MMVVLSRWSIIEPVEAVVDMAAREEDCLLRIEAERTRRDA